MTGLPLTERVSILGNTPAGLQLLSDVTTSLDEPYRPACVNRLVSLVVRAARIVGEESVFEPSGERLWVELRERLTTLLLQLYRAGALRGANAGEAFSVRCDRSTTSQNDIDAGRVIVDIGDRAPRRRLKPSGSSWPWTTAARCLSSPVRRGRTRHEPRKRAVAAQRVPLPGGLR